MSLFLPMNRLRMEGGKVEVGIRNRNRNRRSETCDMSSPVPPTPLFEHVLPSPPSGVAGCGLGGARRGGLIPVLGGGCTPDVALGPTLGNRKGSRVQKPAEEARREIEGWKEEMGVYKNTF